MAARPRVQTRKDWPRGLQESRPGYFIWMNPITKAAVSIGRIPLADAKMQAIEANLWASQQMGATRLIDRLQQQDKTVGEWLDAWLKDLKLAENTIKTYRTSIKAIKEQIGNHALARLSVKDCDEAVTAIATQRGDRSAQVARSVMSTAFRKAITKGLLSSNPVEVVEAPVVVVARQRFTWETFSKVWEALQDAPVWLRNATALALLTGQRREDIAEMKFADVVDGHLRVTPGKNGGAIKLEIPVDLRMERFGLSLKEQILVCRRTGVVSKFMIHQTQRFGNSPPGQQIWRDTITRRFTDYVVKALGDEPNLPTFHELRSLSKRVYMEQGGVDTKALLGHSTEEIAALYGNARGAEFQRVKIA
nr:tyrosine-type recombinase/integrase [Variovorax sp.]